MRVIDTRNMGKGEYIERFGWMAYLENEAMQAAIDSVDLIITGMRGGKTHLLNKLNRDAGITCAPKIIPREK